MFFFPKKYESVLKTEKEKEKGKEKGKEKMEEKGKEKGKDDEDIKRQVKTYVTKMSMDIVICSILLSVQSSIDIKTPKRKTLSGCIYSFSGYPLGPEDDKSSLYFMSCICKQLKTRKQFPFYEKEFVARNMQMCRKFIQSNAEIAKRLEEKRTHLLNHESIPESLNLAHQWIHFYPPIVPIDLGKQLAPVSKGNHEEFKLQMKKGNPVQWQHIGVNQVNIMRHSFGVLEIINEIVMKRDAILKTQLQKPFLENACCSESQGQKNPWLYFVEKEPILLTYYDVILKTGNLLYKLTTQVKAPFLHLHNNVDTASSLAVPNVLCAYSEVLRYTVMIRYCHLDSEIYPIPSYLSTVVREKHPDYNAKGSIEEKIAFFKENNLSLSFAKFTNMMSLIQNHNRIQVQTQTNEEFKDMFIFDAWKTMLASHPNLSFIQPHLLALFAKKIENRDKDDGILVEIENYLQLQIDEYKKTISSNFPLSQVKMNTVFDHIAQISMNEEISVSSLGGFVKNYLYLLCLFVVTPSTKPSIPDHWGLLPRDQRALADALDKTTQVRHFPEYLLKKMKRALEPFYHFVKTHCFTFFPLNKKKLWNRFFTFVLFYVFHAYVLISKEPENLDLGDELSMTDEDIEHVDIQNDNEEVMETILTYMTNVFKHEQKSMITYQDILKNVTREKEQEKSKMKKHFENLDILERKTEVLIKKFQLDQFYIDQTTLQKYGNKRDKMIRDTEGVYTYQQETKKGEKEKGEKDDDEDDDEDGDSVDFLDGEGNGEGNFGEDHEENDEYDMAEYEG